MLQTSYDFQDAIKMFGELVDLEREYAGKTTQPQCTLSGDDLKRHVNEGKILTSFCLPVFVPDLALELSQRICNIVLEYRPEKESRIEKLIKYLVSNPYFFKDFFEENYVLTLPLPKQFLSSSGSVAAVVLPGMW